MATAGFPLWSTTAASNGNSDPAVNMAEGMAPSAVNDSVRAAMASLAKWRDDLYGITAGLATGGTSTAYTVTTNSTYASASVMSGAIFSIVPHTTSGAAPTLAVDGLTARALNASSGVAVSTGALKSGTPYFVRYLHASTEFIVIGQTFTGDLLKVINDLTSDTSPDSAADYVATYDASAGVSKKVLLSTLPVSLPRGFIDGCIISNGTTDSTNDIDIAAGKCRDSTDTVDIIVPAIAGKQLDANWAAGGAAGMRNSAVGIANTTYHLYAVRTAASATADIYAHTSTTVATVLTALQLESGGSSYVYARRIGSIIRSGGTILAFMQTSDEFHIAARQFYNSTSAQALTLTDTLVPGGIVVNPLISIQLVMGTAGSVVISVAPGANSAFSENAVLGGTASQTHGARFSGPPTNVSAQIYYAVVINSGTITSLTASSGGWLDRRGKDA